MMLINENINNDKSYTFVGNLPEDLVYATGENLHFDYFVYDDNGNNVRPNFDFYADSYKIENTNDYVWSYFFEYNEETYHTPGKYVPGYQDNRVHFKINNISRNIQSDSMLIDLDIVYRPLFYPDYIEGYGWIMQTVYDFDNQLIDIYINDELYEEFELDVDYYGNENIENFQFEISGDVVFDNIDMVINTTTNNDKDYHGEVINEQFLIQSDINEFLDIDFNDTQKYEIIRPISYDYVNKEYEYEYLTLSKLFPNTYKYPTTTKNLMTMKYWNDVENLELSIPNSIEAEITSDFYNVENIEIKTNYDSTNNEWMFYIDESFYYDELNQEIVSGKSNFYLNENGLVLPWDKSSKNSIYFELNTKGYTPYNFRINLSFANQFSLRGKNGKYEIKEFNL